ncbi:Protein FAM63A [Glycine soja]|nr:Protein FAM63A [Glycine soja]
MAASSSSPSKEPQLKDEEDREQEEQHQQPQPVKECVHKTKTIQFLGRTTPIVLQNDNGPCPLLAICNVLLLRNNLNLSPDIAEVSQEKLLSLVAERLIDSNSNVNNKDAGYVENQQQNIADAIDLLPRLATGIDVNIKFRRIGDFEFTRECAIFDLLDIPLYHGWIVDPQDYDTANAIGSKSYNSLMGELVSLETLNMEVHHKNNPEEDCVDFVAATTATLGVPSPSLSKARSFDDSSHSISDHIQRKGDLEEEAELLRVLKMSEDESDPVVGHMHGGEISVSMDRKMCNDEVINMDCGDKLGNSSGAGNSNFHEHGPEPSLSDDCAASGKDHSEQISSTSTLGEAANSSLKTDTISDLHQSTYTGPEESFDLNDVIEKNSLDALVQNESEVIPSPEKHSVSLFECRADFSGGDGKVHDQSTPTTIDHEVVGESHGPDATGLSFSSPGHTNSDSSSVRYHQTDVSGALTSSVQGSEPIYEGEECVLDTRTGNFEDREPVYEGEVVLAEQSDKSTLAAPDLRAKDELTPEQGELIKSFLRNNASQLTFYGLFCLQDGLKERELCVFFRNNHFSTMFKFEGELYLLATDQGYINQPDLVWEKLNEVNGDTLFMTGNFKEFKVENHESSTWDENNALTSTADYLASIDSATHAGLDINSDLQLAIALQQQEFEQQPPRQNNSQPQSSISGSSRLVTGPQVARNTGRHSSSSTSASPRSDAKSKDKCIVM